MATFRYQVASDDDPLSLSKRFGIPAQELLQQNGLQSLTAGQSISVPYKPPTNPVSATGSASGFGGNAAQMSLTRGAYRPGGASIRFAPGNSAQNLSVPAAVGGSLEGVPIAGGARQPRLAQMTRWNQAAGGIGTGGFDAGNQSFQVSPGIFSIRRAATNVGAGAGAGISNPSHNAQVAAGGYGYQGPPGGYSNLAAQPVNTNLQAFNRNPAYTAAPLTYQQMAIHQPFLDAASGPEAGWGQNGWQGAVPEGFSKNKGGGLVQNGIKGNNWRFNNGVTYAVYKGGRGGSQGGPSRPSVVNKQTQSALDWRVAT